MEYRNVAPVRLLRRLAHETDPWAAVGDGKRDVHLFGLQVDILDEQSEKLFANSGPCCVATVGYILTDPEGVGTPAHCCD